MKEKMLSVVTTPTLRGALARLFREYPFQEMNASFARENNCGGICFEDGGIFILPGGAKWMLATYLHEVAHAAMMKAGHADKFDHGSDFVAVCRSLQRKFDVVDSTNHDYDQQDSSIKISHAYSCRRADKNDLDNYCPTTHAEELASEERARYYRCHGRSRAEMRR